MAESKQNAVVHGASGKFGDLIVFRQQGGKTILAQPPSARTGEPSAAQQAVRDKFQRAILYGKMVIADPQLKKEYQAAAERGQSAFNVAVADFGKAPDIILVDVSSYTGQVGQPIKMKVTDNFKVKSVNVSIENEDGTLVEEGEAVRDANAIEWTYTTKAVNETITGDKITITAKDNPDNVTTKGAEL